jgi:DNA-binding NarL/FixJ family response regulator
MREAPVVVVTDVPMFKAGLQAVLSSAGFCIEDPPDSIEWARTKAAQRRRAGIVLTIGPGAADRELGRFSLFRCVSVLALTHVAEPAVQLAAIAAGASGAINWSADSPSIIRALDAALLGLAVLPATFLRYLAPRDGSWVASEEQVDCLRLLAVGMPVRSMAHDFHYSEREMFRRLRALYDRLGASGRHEALIRAKQLGLV